MPQLNNAPHIAINAGDETPRDGYVYYSLFNRFRLVDVVHTYDIYNPTKVVIPDIKSLISMKTFQHSRRNMHNLDGRILSFLISTCNATRNIEKESLSEENSTLLEVQVKC